MNRFEPLEDEHIILEMPKHWRNYILPVVAMGAILGAIAIRLAFPETSLLNRLAREPLLPTEAVQAISYLEATLFAVLLVCVSVSVVAIAYTRYYVTNKRVVSTSGWINVKVCDMLLERVETVSLSQRAVERIFNSGDLLVVSAGASIYLDDVYDARRFRQTVMQEMTKNQTD